MPKFNEKNRKRTEKNVKARQKDFKHNFFFFTEKNGQRTEKNVKARQKDFKHNFFKILYVLLRNEIIYLIQNFKFHNLSVCYFDN